VNIGSEANDMAIMMARLYTGKYDRISNTPDVPPHFNAGRLLRQQRQRGQ